jgi:hypothetical protein
MQPNIGLLERMQKRVNEDWSDDEEKSLAEEDAITESSRFFSDLTSEDRDLLQQMSSHVDHLPDSKFEYICQWIESHLKDGTGWNRERLVLFTEYKDTLNYLTERLIQRYGEDSILSLYGGMNMADREYIKATFQTDPDETPVRILVATDAASEGLNLQAHCRYLIHYEIPWNPNRMEQRNGRIDRHGQKADVVNIYHFVYANREDSRFLQTVVDKVKTMANDLGSVGDVIATQVEEAMLGKRGELQLPTRIENVTQDVIRGEAITEHRIREIRRQMDRTRDELSINPETQVNILDAALRVMGQSGISSVDDPDLQGKVFRLRDLPPSWGALEKYLKNADGHWLNITFYQDIAASYRSTTLLHLNHPLMRQAIGTFRGRLWSIEGDRGLNRVSYRVAPDYSVPVVVAYGRLVVIGNDAQRLHEEVITVGAEIDDKQLYPLDEPDVTRLLGKGYQFPSIPTSIANQLRAYFPLHNHKLIQMLNDALAVKRASLENTAVKNANEDAEAVRALISERLQELNVRLKNELSNQNKANNRQLELFDRDEYLQYQEDLKWLQQKQVALQNRLKTEPQRIQTGYDIRDIRIFPIGLLYLLPEHIVKG